MAKEINNKIQLYVYTRRIADISYKISWIGNVILEWIVFRYIYCKNHLSYMTSLIQLQIVYRF